MFENLRLIEPPREILVWISEPYPHWWAQLMYTTSLQVHNFPTLLCWQFCRGRPQSAFAALHTLFRTAPNNDLLNGVEMEVQFPSICVCTNPTKNFLAIGLVRLFGVTSFFPSNEDIWTSATTCTQRKELPVHARGSLRNQASSSKVRTKYSTIRLSLHFRGALLR